MDGDGFEDTDDYDAWKSPASLIASNYAGWRNAGRWTRLRWISLSGTSSARAPDSRFTRCGGVSRPHPRVLDVRGVMTDCLAVNGTSFFSANGHAISGAVSLAGFKHRIEAAGAQPTGISQPAALTGTTAARTHPGSCAS
jgi:hypothetical protein